jgi:hypothetical protein
LKKPDPVDVLKRREKWKTEFEENLPPKNKFGVRCEAILRDISRMDSYPGIDQEAKGISPWFKVEVKGLYHRGIEVFTSMPKSIKLLVTGGWTFCHYDDENAATAYPVGRIPFDQIEHIDWRGDEYYPGLHIYVRFKDDRRMRPYCFIENTQRMMNLCWKSKASGHGIGRNGGNALQTNLNPARIAAP